MDARRPLRLLQGMVCSVGQTRNCHVLGHKNLAWPRPSSAATPFCTLFRENPRTLLGASAPLADGDPDEETERVHRKAGKGLEWDEEHPRQTS